MRRGAVFFFYDEAGVVDGYIFFLLGKLRPFVETIIFVSNGDLSKASEISVRSAVDDIVIRENIGFDVGAYSDGLKFIGYDKLGDYDEILLLNHTFYGPLFPFSEMFSEMESRDCDFWGISDHKEMVPSPFTGQGSLAGHLNSHFIAVRRTMLVSHAFRNYWESMPAIGNYTDSVLIHESRFTKFFEDLAFKSSSYVESSKYSSNYPVFIDVDETILDRSTILKRRLFFGDPPFLEQNGIELPRALRVLKATSDYDFNLIWRNVLRSSELRNLNTNAALMSVLPDERAKGDGAPTDYGNVAVCAHVYYTDLLDEILALTENIPVSYDFIATTDTAEKKAEIETALAKRPGVKKAIVRVIEKNRGRDMSSLFISLRDLLIDDRYDLVCRLHTKKSPQVQSSRGNLFKRHMLENLLNTGGYVHNVLDMFQGNPSIGLAIPPIFHISYPTMGHSWFANRPKVEELARLLKINVKLDESTPVAAYGTMFWFRPRALRKLFEHRWKWEEFNAEPDHLDGGLAHALERLIAYAAQDAGYTTQHIMCAHQAAHNYTMLEFKLQKLASLMPTGDFHWQCHMLSEWKKAGYPSANHLPAPMPWAQTSVKHSLAGLNFAVKNSLKFRAPVLFKVLRPIYRGMASVLKPRSRT
ncbi:rhamnan synthesis F family protein [Mesorhizobium huakuii]|uniref:rhamnan synthesis F family protein n=1 Tax=Mesorhizobium huakuii TaxID=28104 RepID=UPI0024E08705|nr:rhamnan synthesis F family protein [Mesorhizobium huakuii]